MNLIIASNNQHKIEELQDILTGHQLIPVGSIFPDFDPTEDGNSFLENSLIKARELYQLLTSRTGKKAFENRFPECPLPPVLADDSGICVDALDGAPGIFSARFGHREAGRKLSPAEQNALLLEILAGKNKRSARYVCCMSLLINNNRFFTAQETWEGEIAPEPSTASGGFGYDPIFFLPERGISVADLPAGEKARVSHRAKATRRILSFLESLGADSDRGN